MDSGDRLVITNTSNGHGYSIFSGISVKGGDEGCDQTVLEIAKWAAKENKKIFPMLCLSSYGYARFEISCNLTPGMNTITHTDPGTVVCSRKDITGN